VCKLRASESRGDNGFANLTRMHTGGKVPPYTMRCGWNSNDGDKNYIGVPTRGKLHTFLATTAVEWIPRSLRVLYCSEFSCFPLTFAKCLSPVTKAWVQVVTKDESRNRAAAKRVRPIKLVTVRNSSQRETHPALDINVGLLVLGPMAIRVTDIPAMPLSDALGLRHYRTVKR